MPPVDTSCQRAFSFTAQVLAPFPDRPCRTIGFFVPDVVPTTNVLSQNAASETVVQQGRVKSASPPPQRRSPSSQKERRGRSRSPSPSLRLLGQSFAGWPVMQQLRWRNRFPRIAIGANVDRRRSERAVRCGVRYR